SRYGPRPPQFHRRMFRYQEPTLRATQPLKTLAVGRKGYASIGDYRRYERIRSDIKGRVKHRDTVGYKPHTAEVGDFGRIALFDWNMRAVGYLHVYCRERCGHVEGDIMLFCEHRNTVCSDLVGDIAICSNPVRTDNDRIN